MIQNMRGVV